MKRLKRSKTKVFVAALLILALFLAVSPLFLQRNAEFTGSDDAGSEMIGEVTGAEYVPWFSPVLETVLGRELPGEVESLLFCVQTGIGVGIIAFCFGYLVARKKYKTDTLEAVQEKQTESSSNST